MEEHVNATPVLCSIFERAEKYFYDYASPDMEEALLKETRKNIIIKVLLEMSDDEILACVNEDRDLLKSVPAKDEIVYMDWSPFAREGRLTAQQAVLCNIGGYLEFFLKGKSEEGRVAPIVTDTQ